MTYLDGGLAATLALLTRITDPGQRLRTFTGAIIEQGCGTIVLPPDDGNTWGPHLVEFSFLGILGTGLTSQEALAEWMKCAERVVTGMAFAACPPPPAHCAGAPA